MLKDVHAVLDLASISNDPAGDLDPKRTMHINAEARARTAMLAKEMGAKRYILASSCSVYGRNSGTVDETSPTEPLTTYAKASLPAEKKSLPLADKNFSVTALRQGTLFGLSPRMRFDLVVNTMTLAFHRSKNISVTGGVQWRPLVHVRDSARAFITVLEADPRIASGQVFNVGSTKQNYQIHEM